MCVRSILPDMQSRFIGIINILKHNQILVSVAGGG